MTMSHDVQDGAAATWLHCPDCRHLLYSKQWQRSLGVCPECGGHGRLTARERITQLTDAGSFTDLAGDEVHHDPLRFVDTQPYPQRLTRARAGTGEDEAVLAGNATVRGQRLVLAVMDFRFLGGSLGIGAGERLVVAAEEALRRRVPLVVVTASGGARMQEGTLSLLQMAKVSQAVAQLGEAGLLYLSVITDPTYGGVAASFATQADVIIAEPAARLGFAGPRVIRDTLHQQLPSGFQTAEFLLRHGAIDRVVERAQLRDTIGRLLRATDPGPAGTPAGPTGLVTDPDLLAARDPWATVALARHHQRPTGREYLNLVTDDFFELHGDRLQADSPAIIGGLAELDGRQVMVVATQKGHSTRELLATNFGMAGPEGYRKALRLFRLAEKLRLPVVTLIDTPGAYPGVTAEEHGQSAAIAANILALTGLTVPIVAVITGEGGSGGALALAVADRVLMFQTSVYSVISPEGCAAILWDASAAPRAAAALRMTAVDLLSLGIIDGVIPEPDGGVHTDLAGAAQRLSSAVAGSLAELATIPSDRLVAIRRRRLRQLGVRTAADTTQPRPTGSRPLEVNR